MDTSKLIPVFKALADDIRLTIVDMLKTRDLCANEILASFSITQPTLSYHMKMLTGSGLVKSHKEGAKTIYTLVPSCLAILTDYAESHGATAPSEPAQPAEEAPKPPSRPVRRQMDSYLL